MQINEPQVTPRHAPARPSSSVNNYSCQHSFAGNRVTFTYADLMAGQECVILLDRIARTSARCWQLLRIWRRSVVVASVCAMLVTQKLIKMAFSMGP